LREAIDIDPEEYTAYNWLGYAYRRLGEEEKACKEYRKAQQILRALCSQYPDDEWYLRYIEGVHRSLGEYEESDRARKKRQTVRNSKILNCNPAKLIAGPDSAIWEEADIFEGT
jgi:tetratricopeptide (TPR) repeat protein